METIRATKKLLPLDTTVKVIMYEVLEHLLEQKRSWNLKFSLPSTGSGYIRIANSIGQLDIRISNHDTKKDENDLYFSYPERDFDTFKLAKEIILYISREFNVKLSLPKKSLMSNLFYAKEKASSAKRKRT